MNVKRGLIFGFLFAFLVVGISTMKRSMPAAKEMRIYKEIKVYMPYELEKKLGGFAIVDKRDGSKEKPSATEVMLRLDEVEGQWGNQYLRVEGTQLLILGDDNNTITKIFIETQEERDFLKRFFGI